MIRVEDVHYTYPSGVEALRGVSLTIGDGEFLAIMGENGAGKTTLIKHFNSLLKPTRGRVLIDGADTRDSSVAELSRKVGLVFQNPDHQLFCETVEEEVNFGLKNFGFRQKTIRERVRWALETLNLERYRKTSPFMLSGGERKRVALASVLAWKPEILVMDEPTIGQDHQQKEKLRQFIVQLNSQGKTVVIVTHDVEFVAYCNPKVALMSRGQVIAEGEAKRILTDPKQVRKASLIPPQVTQAIMELKELELPRDLIDVYEAGEALLKILEGRRV